MLIIGRRYNRMKKKNDGSRGNQHTEADATLSPAITTAAKLAKEHGVSERTVKRAGESFG